MPQGRGGSRQRERVTVQHSLRDVERKGLQIDLQIDIFQADARRHVQPHGSEVQNGLQAGSNASLRDLGGGFAGNADDTDLDSLGFHDGWELGDVMHAYARARAGADLSRVHVEQGGYLEFSRM